MTETTVIVDYGSGNLRSAEKALARAATDAGLDTKVVVTANAEQVAAADRILLPGVGAFGDCMKGLSGLPGMIDALDAAVIRRGVPFLGICVGMQLMFREGREHGVHPGLGWLDGAVARIVPADPALKVPHMGWNRLDVTAAGVDHPVLAGFDPETYVYFVHSYAAEAVAPANLLATTDYGAALPAIVGRDNMLGMQFHPEKSQAAGLDLLAAFLGWRP